MKIVTGRKTEIWNRDWHTKISASQKCHTDESGTSEDFCFGSIFWWTLGKSSWSSIDVALKYIWCFVTLDEFFAIRQTLSDHIFACLTIYLKMWPNLSGCNTYLFICACVHSFVLVRRSLLIAWLTIYLKTRCQLLCFLSTLTTLILCITQMLLSISWSSSMSWSSSISLHCHPHHSYSKPVRILSSGVTVAALFKENLPFLKLWTFVRLPI